jgi:hypothetical protein
LIDGQVRREVGHYGDMGEDVSDEQAQESHLWAEEFIRAARDFLEKQP